MIFIGIVLAVLLGVYQIKRHGLCMDNFIIISAMGCLFGIVGSKILYIIVSWNSINFERLKDIKYINTLMRGGFVFYGGIIGGAVGILLSRSLLKIDIGEYLRISIPVIPVAHGIGRIGCALVGCCYGIPYDGPLAVTYTDSLFAPNNVPLFPVQLTEAAMELLIAGFLIIYINRLSGKRAVLWYVLLYSVVRFMLEFFRNDAERGNVFFLSVSQFISLLLITAVVVIYRFTKKPHIRKDI